MTAGQHPPGSVGSSVVDLTGLIVTVLASRRLNLQLRASTVTPGENMTENKTNAGSVVTSGGGGGGGGASLDSKLVPMLGLK